LHEKTPLVQIKLSSSYFAARVHLQEYVCLLIFSFEGFAELQGEKRKSLSREISQKAHDVIDISYPFQLTVANISAMCGFCRT